MIHYLVNMIDLNALENNAKIIIVDLFLIKKLMILIPEVMMLEAMLTRKKILILELIEILMLLML